VCFSTEIHAAVGKRWANCVMAPVAGYMNYNRGRLCSIRVHSSFIFSPSIDKRGNQSKIQGHDKRCLPPMSFHNNTQQKSISSTHPALYRHALSPPVPRLRKKLVSAWMSSPSALPFCWPHFLVTAPFLLARRVFWSQEGPTQSDVSVSVIVT